MPRTFNLQGLFLAVTLCGVLLWFVLAFPYTTLGMLLFAGWFVPSFVVSLVLSRYSSRRRVTVSMGMAGALIGFFGFLYAVMVSMPNLRGDWWEIYLYNYPLLSLPAAGCALVFAGSSCLENPR
jgi:hypothetical protein